MPRYISLLNWTDQGARTVKDTVSRGHAARDAFKDGGGTLVDIYWTLGQHDACLIFEAPDAETATRLVLALARHGNVRSITMPAFNEPEMEQIAKGL